MNFLRINPRLLDWLRLRNRSLSSLNRRKWQRKSGKLQNSGMDSNLMPILHRFNAWRTNLIRFHLCATCAKLSEFLLSSRNSSLKMIQSSWSLCCRHKQENKCSLSLRKVRRGLQLLTLTLRPVSLLATKSCLSRLLILQQSTLLLRELTYTILMCRRCCSKVKQHSKTEIMNDLMNVSNKPLISWCSWLGQWILRLQRLCKRWDQFSSNLEISYKPSNFRLKSSFCKRKCLASTHQWTPTPTQPSPSTTTQ